MDTAQDFQAQGGGLFRPCQALPALSLALDCYTASFDERGVRKAQGGHVNFFSVLKHRRFLGAFMCKVTRGSVNSILLTLTILHARVLLLHPTDIATCTAGSRHHPLVPRKEQVQAVLTVDFFFCFLFFFCWCKCVA